MPDRIGFMASKIIHDHDVAFGQCRNEELLYVFEEAGAIDRAIEHARSRYLVSAKRCYERQRIPVTMRRLAQQPLSSGAPASEARHIGLCPCFIDEDQPPWIEGRLQSLPPYAAARNVRSILLAAEQAFF